LPLSSGFADAKGTCCPTGTKKTRVYLCNPATTAAAACRNASSYVFFDGVHPSEAANVVIAQSVADAGIELIS
jgi:phospholipase/lecithinase/hemolysin